MERKIKKRCVNVFLLFMLGILASTSGVFAQGGSITVKGNVKDANNEPIISGSVVVKGTINGTLTDLDGNYEITNVPSGGTLVFTYVGFMPQEIPVNGRTTINVTLEEDTELLEEVVVIGYGRVKKSDLSGSIVAIKAEEINKGAITSPQQMLQGKVSGLFVQPGNGAPGSGSTIRIRSGASLSASNDPLIVIDGIPTSNDAAPGTPNALATINPNDIESFTVLKDASATAIYGSRASNGVIIITTKKGSQAKGVVKIDYSSTYSFNDPYKKIKTMNADEFYQTISTYYPQGTKVGDAAQAIINQYPMLRTNWQDAIFRTAFSTDQNLSFSGRAGMLPYRVSVGYTNENGTLRTSNYERYTGSISLSPKFFDDHLSVNINVKGTINNNRFADSGAVGTAAFYDPTKPIYDENGYHGYWNHMQGTEPNKLASNNPVSMLYDVENYGKTKRSLGNIQLDYKLHFLPELHANLNLGYDVATSTGHNGSTAGSYQAAKDSDLPDVGRYSAWDQLRRNQLLDFYLNYNKYFESIQSNIDVMGGYSYQHFYQSNFDKTFSNPTDFIGNKEGFDYDETLRQYVWTASRLIPSEDYLISFFGRLNYNFKDRYLLTATLRDDGSSRFSKDHRWGLFPSAALAWTISKEPFMQGKFNALSNLKLRVGYGVTGQQDVGTSYGYIPYYQFGTNPNSTYLGSGLLRPLSYNPNLKWEQTSTTNVGIDFGFLNNRINSSIEYYHKKTKDLLNSIDSPAGTNFANRLVANVGNMKNDGVEFNINAVVIETPDFSWDLGYNITWNRSEITNLTASYNPDYPGISQGNPGYGTGGYTQKHQTGYTPFTFWLYQQVYGEDGKPVQNVFVDRNKDRQITEADRYMTDKSPMPKVYMGLSSTFKYKNFDLGFNLRANFGNYAFNAFAAQNSTPVTFNNQGFLSNIYTGVYDTGFTQQNNGQQVFSDYFLENASFLKMDNLTFGYSFRNVLFNKLSGRLSFSVQNVFTITNYRGLDPENSGVDNNIWPRPRTYTFGLNLNF
ncbi:MAG: TonB-dependent receptor [Prevotella sp.]|jgi:iron complex outermembrane receptor protein|nr:TonB-dependent receptor [Prevotella sp.]